MYSVANHDWSLDGTTASRVRNARAIVIYRGIGANAGKLATERAARKSLPRVSDIRGAFAQSACVRAASQL